MVGWVSSSIGVWKPTARAGCEAISRPIVNGWSANSKRRTPRRCARRTARPASDSIAYGRLSSLRKRQPYDKPVRRTVSGKGSGLIGGGTVERKHGESAKDGPWHEDQKRPAPALVCCKHGQQP